MRFVIGLIALVILFNGTMLFMGFSYKNSTINTKATQIIEQVILEQKDKEIGFIEKYTYAPTAIQITNNSGIVVRKIKTKDGKKKYISLKMIKSEGEWAVTSIQFTDKNNMVGFSMKISK